MLKLKVNDQIKVKLGKDKGREGKIAKVFPKTGKVLVEGINVYKKHVKAAMTVDKKGGIFEISRPMLAGKVVLICPKCKKVTRVAFGLEKGKKVRICAKCRKEI